MCRGDGVEEEWPRGLLTFVIVFAAILASMGGPSASLLALVERADAQAMAALHGHGAAHEGGAGGRGDGLRADLGEELRARLQAYELHDDEGLDCGDSEQENGEHLAQHAVPEQQLVQAAEASGGLEGAAPDGVAQVHRQDFGHVAGVDDQVAIAWVSATEALRDLQASFSDGGGHLGISVAAAATFVDRVRHKELDKVQHQHGGQVAECVLDCSARGSDVADGSLLCIDRRRLPPFLHRLASAVPHAQWHYFSLFANTLVEGVLGAGGECVSITEAERYDETPLSAKTQI